MTIFLADNSSAADCRPRFWQTSSHASEIMRSASSRLKVNSGGVPRSAAGRASHASAASTADGTGVSSLQTKSSVCEVMQTAQDTDCSRASPSRTKRKITLVASAGRVKSGMSFKSAMPARVWLVASSSPSTLNISTVGRQPLAVVLVPQTDMHDRAGGVGVRSQRRITCGNIHPRHVARGQIPRQWKILCRCAASSWRKSGSADSGCGRSYAASTVEPGAIQAVFVILIRAGEMPVAVPDFHPRVVALLVAPIPARRQCARARRRSGRRPPE